MFHQHHATLNRRRLKQALLGLAVPAALALGAALPTLGWAQATTGTASASTAPAPSMTQGEVRRVDPQAGKVTLKHGPIPHLDMPGMTMVFTVRDKSLLDHLKTGDKIQFMVLNEGGKPVLTDIQPLR